MERTVCSRPADDAPRFLRLVAHPVRWRLLRELVHSDRAVWELTQLLGERQSLVSYHLSQLRRGGLGRSRRRPRILFLCTGNSARSQIAEALLERMSEGTIEAASAGGNPKPLHAHAVRVMKKRGIDISTNRTKHLDEFLSQRSAFADVKRGNLRLLLAGPKSSAGRPMPDGRTPGPGGWNRIHFVVDNIDADVRRLRDAGATFRNDIVTGPGGKQILLEDPSGNVVELFQPAAR